ncbi:hypothetical protein BVC80_8755g16 [Macleaya cordata]|uniref:Uncharacterized protein n=1 Tax=Macleaya cordata TaxID=56857 RepID=A0A200PXK3_MACCD|nr:hypothetical protein BVC80_8755g16 [Macleaya cordata]
MAAKRRRKRVILRTEAQVTAMEILRRQGLHSSSSSSGPIACFNEDLALNPPRFLNNFSLSLSTTEMGWGETFLPSFVVTHGKVGTDRSTNLNGQVRY